MPKRFDEHGVLLADVPGSGASKIDPNARSGNPRHDTRSGKFGSGGGGNKAATPPANTQQLDYHRMLDAVREASRSIDTPDESNVTEFIQERANAPDQVDIANFLQLINAQRKQDLVDVLDQQLKGTSHRVRMTASRVYMRRIIRTLPPEDVAEVVHRLEAMGHESKKILKFFPQAPTGIEATDSDVWGMAPPGWVELADVEEEPPAEEE